MKYSSLRKILFLGLVIILAVVFILVMWEQVPSTFYPKTVSLEGRAFSLEIAATREAQARGLSGRESLCDTCGMLFTFRLAAQQSFWMKDMRFPLDIIWLRDGEVVAIEHTIPADASAIFSPESSANQVLEVNAGAAQSVIVGDVLIFSTE